ncbi:MAG: DUF488 family protein [Desulforhabdus sp.]|jgi:uncharacterized protein YeaO (DUF488 family)|nr:DUF488 family protein [Desulforhabdus sp.]
MIKLKRAYEAPGEDDGGRYLVDRLWPRGIARDDARLSDWLKDLAPSEELRKWFGHDPKRWKEFKQRYKLELRAAAKEQILEDLAQKAKRGNITLVFAAKDSEHNNAVVVKEVLEKKLAKD